MTWLNLPCCERCWIERHTTYHAKTQEMQVRQPVRMKEPELETCGFCGQPTISGIFVRAEVHDG